MRNNIFALNQKKHSPLLGCQNTNLFPSSLKQLLVGYSETLWMTFPCSLQRGNSTVVLSLFSEASVQVCPTHGPFMAQHSSQHSPSLPCPTRHHGGGSTLLSGLAQPSLCTKGTLVHEEPHMGWNQDTGKVQCSASSTDGKWCSGFFFKLLLLFFLHWLNTVLRTAKNMQPCLLFW